MKGAAGTLATRVWSNPIRRIPFSVITSLSYRGLMFNYALVRTASVHIHVKYVVSLVCTIYPYGHIPIQLDML